MLYGLFVNELATHVIEYYAKRKVKRPVNMNPRAQKRPSCYYELKHGKKPLIALL